VSRTIFVAGTDTGVGKTLLTASLLFHLRQSGVHALAMKPFCSGGTEDVDLIRAIQGDEARRQDVNPFWFPEPVAPLVAARKRRRKVELSEVLAAIRRMEKRCDCLIIEGSGGVLVPLAERFTVADLIAKLGCAVVVVGRNKLGTINHTLLTVEALRARGLRRIKIVLMEQRIGDRSAADNPSILRGHLAGLGVFVLPYCGSKATNPGVLKKNAGSLKKTLAWIADPASFSPRSSERSLKSGKPKRLTEQKVC
jgi:dethiobiotin synthetase